MQYESSIVAPLQLAVANTSLQCMCCLGNTRYLAQGCVLFRSVLCPAWLGSPVCPVCPCCPFTWPFTAQHSCWPEKSAKIFFTPLALSLSHSLSFFSAASGLHGLSINTPFAFIQYKSSAAGQTKGDTAGGRVYGGRGGGLMATVGVAGETNKAHLYIKLVFQEWTRRLRPPPPLSLSLLFVSLTALRVLSWGSTHCSSLHRAQSTLHCANP